MGSEMCIRDRYKVRWIEAAIVSPCWTTMIVYYVEGDMGHLMNEEMGQQKFRTVVRGSCSSYHMPWEDILQQLRKNCSDRNVAVIPRPEECLKYMLRVHLSVNGLDFKKHLKQVHVRPFVLIHLLDFLIDRNHEVFRGKGSAEELRTQMRAAVQREYPEQEGSKPEEDREGTIPSSVLAALHEAQASNRDEKSYVDSKRRKLRIVSDKNARAGDGARSLATCLDDLRPHAVCMDKSVQACSDPATLREGALERFGELEVKTGGKMLAQWAPKYFSQILSLIHI